MQWFLQLSDNFCLSAWEGKKNTKTHMLWDGVKLNKWDFHGKSVWNKSAVKLTDCTCMSNCATTEFWLTRYPRGSRNAHSMEQCNLRKEHTTSIWTWTLLTMYSHSHPHMAVDGQWSVYSVTHTGGTINWSATLLLHVSIMKLLSDVGGAMINESRETNHRR